MDRRIDGSAVLVLGGLAVLIAAARRRLVVLCLCGAILMGLVGVNRLLEPVEERYCGSVLNRHTSNGTDNERDAACDDLVRPHRNQGATALAAAVLLIAAAGVSWRPSREPEGSSEI